MPFPIILETDRGKCSFPSVLFCDGEGMASSFVDSDQYVFGPPGSGSVGQRYGSGSFYHQAKITRKTLIPIVS
jgi:hypothetical protein